MSSVYNTFYEMAFIPCNSPHENAALENGTGQVNVDGKTIMGGIKVNQQCVIGGFSTNEGGYVGGNKQLFYVGGFSPSRFSATKNVMASNAHTARSTRANYL
jgi:hypothetical protein